jgi:phosphatidylinositol 4-kinase
MIIHEQITSPQAFSWRRVLHVTQVCNTKLNFGQLANHYSVEYLSKHRSQNSLLKLLIENEIARLRVWANPTNDLKRGQDYLSNSERSLTDVGPVSIT